jgi:hypothetical protein
VFATRLTPFNAGPGSSSWKPLRDRWLLAMIAFAAIQATAIIWLTRTFRGLTPDATEYALVARSLVRGTGVPLIRLIASTALASRATVRRQTSS